MKLMAFQLLPDDFFEDDEESNVRAASTTQELIIARDIAVENPERWVLVGDTRFLFKDFSAWCSEVNTGKKAALQRTDGAFRAKWWIHSDEEDNGRREYGKALAFFPGKMK